MTNPIDMVSGFMLPFAHSLNREQSILRPAIAFFANAALLAPKIAINRVPLGHLVVAVALRKVHFGAVGELAEQVQYFPLKVVWRTLGRIAEEDLVLNLEPAKIRV